MEGSDNEFANFNLHHTSPKNSHAVCSGFADTLTFNKGNIHGRTSWVCIHPYSVVKATSVTVCCWCAFTHTLLWRQHPRPYVVGVHSPILSWKQQCIPCRMQSNLAPWVCVIVSVCVRCLCKHFHVGLLQTESKKKRRRNGYGRQMSYGIQPLSFSCSCSLCQLHIHTHRLACTHLLSNGMGQWLHTRAYKHLQLVTHWKAKKTLPPPPQQQDRKLPAFDLATLLLAWSTLLQVHWSFISLCLFGRGGGGGVSSYICHL